MGSSLRVTYFPRPANYRCDTKAQKSTPKSLVTRFECNGVSGELNKVVVDDGGLNLTQELTDHAIGKMKTDTVLQHVKNAVSYGGTRRTLGPLGMPSGFQHVIVHSFYGSIQLRRLADEIQIILRTVEAWCLRRTDGGVI